MAVRIVVADDHTVVRQGIVGLLRERGGYDVVGEAADGLDAVSTALAERPDVVVLDLTMPRLSGLEAARRIRDELPRCRILFLSMHDDEEYIVAAVAAGASGFIAKDAAAGELLDAVRSLARGEGYFSPKAARILAEQYRRPSSIDTADPYGSLTPREREVFHLVAEGRTTKEVAAELGISPKTAENHRTRLMDKLGVRSVAELVRYAAKKGLLD